jgi:succinate dehydrogenase/fumarate reductase flavoprotein subunit
MTKRKWEALSQSVDPGALRKLHTRLLWELAVRLRSPKDLMEAEQTIKAGREAWKRIKKTPARKKQNYRDWQALSDALEMGESVCAKMAGKKEGGGYARLMKAWLQLNDMSDIATSTRAWMRAVRKDQLAIEAWRNSLPPEQRMKLTHPLTILKHWKKASQRPNQAEMP